MKFGTKIPFDLFTDSPTESTRLLAEAFGGKGKLLAYCGQEFDGAEIGILNFRTDKNALLRAAQLCHENGLFISVHGDMKGAKDAEEFFSPYLLLFASGLQSLYNITVHPLQTKEETEKMLREICAMIEEKGYPARIALENQRVRGDGDISHTLVLGVTETFKAVASPHLGLCFDFGHRLSNLRKRGEGTDPVCDSFFQNCVHTHIHSFKDGATHFPLHVGEVDLEYNITNLMRHGYDGLFLLELAPDRYLGQYDLKEAMIASLSTLKAAVHQVAHQMREREKYEKDYPAAVRQVRKGLAEKECALGVLGPAMYVLKLGGTLLAIDPALWALPIGEEGKRELLALLSACDGTVVTHVHCDHYDPKLLALLPEGKPRLLPEFLPYKDGDTVTVKEGEIYKVGDVSLKFFSSAHASVPELGFAAEYKGKHYVFPTDVRDYTAPVTAFPETEALVAHLWLGRTNALNLHENGYGEDFRRFARAFGARKIFLGHLYDFRREITDLWTDIHFPLVKDLAATPLRLGDVVEL